MNILSKSIVAALFIVAVISNSASGDLIIMPANITTTGGGTLGPHQSDLSQTIDNSGLSSPLNDGDVVPGTLPTHSGIYVSNAVRWIINNANWDVPDEITFDLGTNHDLSSIIFYNYHEGAGGGFTDRGIQTADIAVSSDGVSFTSVGSQSFAQAVDNGDGSINGELIGFSHANVSHVRFSNLVSHGSGLVGFGEIRFARVEAVPEPGSLACFGICLFGLMTRRRRAI